MKVNPLKKFRAMWQLVRLEHGLMFGFAVFIGALIAGSIDKNVAIAIIVAIFLEMASFSLNDYFDIDIDRKNKRMDRPLARGDISTSVAITIAAIFFPLGIFSSYFINNECFFIASITAIFAIIYDAWLKKIKVAGNIYIAYTMAIPFIFGAFAVNGSQSIVYFLAILAFLSGIAREIMKDIMDFKGDSSSGIKSFPHYIGIKGAAILASILYILASILSFIPFFIKIDSRYFHSYAYGIPVVIADAIFLFVAFQMLMQLNARVLKKGRNYSLLAIFTGLIAFLLPLF